ncbi:MAG: hypothetical protein ACRENE_31780 [Polyangiaceae bacterium]
MRCLTPGDDLTYPFLATERLFHAESSGASALAAGVALLVVSNNPLLRAEEILTLLARSAAAPEGLSPEAFGGLADPADVLPARRDADGHDAKHGYGRLHALRACLSARDPVSLELVAMGEVSAAGRWAEARKTDPVAAGAYGPAMGWLAVRALLADDALAHAVRVVLRHLRLLASDPRRAAAQHPAAAVRQVALALRRLEGAPAMRSDRVGAELPALLARARAATDAASTAGGDAPLVAIASTIFGSPVGGPDLLARPVPGEGPSRLAESEGRPEAR